MAYTGGPVNISDIACDARCQLDTQKNTLKLRYETKLREYIDIYRLYQNLKFNRDASGNPLPEENRGANETLAENSRPRLIALNTELNTIISELNQILQNSKNNIAKNTEALASQNRSLLENNLLVNQIGKTVEQRYGDLKTKEKLIEYNKQKNNYKKRIMSFLLMGNLIIIVVLVFLFMRGQNQQVVTQPAL